MPRAPRSVHLSASIACVVLAGCVRFHASPLEPSWPASRHLEHRTVAGLSVAVQEIAPGTHELEVIGRPVRAGGYLPVILYFENQGSSRFVIRRQGMHLETRDGQRFEAAPLNEVHAASRYSKSLAAWSLPLGIFPAFLISKNVDEENDDFLRDLRRKAIRDLRLSGSPDRYECLVFFRMTPERTRRTRQGDYTVVVEVVREGESAAEDETLRFTLIPEDPLN